MSGVALDSSSAPLSVLPASTWIYLFHVVAYVLVFLIVQSAAGSAKGGRRSTAWILVGPLLVLGGLEAALGLAWRTDPTGPVLGTYYNKNHFAGLLEMIQPFALMFGVAVLSSRHDRRALSVPAALGGAGLIALAALMFVGIALSLSKAGFAAAVGSLLVMALVAASSRLTRGKRWAAIFVSAALAVLVFLLLQPAALVSQYGTMLVDDTGEGRVPVARDTARLIAAFPLFGSGLGTYFPALLRYQTSALDFAVMNAHNDYLQLVAELGFLGFSVLVVAAGALLTHVWRVVASSTSRNARFLGLACFGGLSALLFHSFADFNLYVPANAMVFSWIAGISSGLPRVDHAHRPIPSERSGSFVRGLALTLGGLATGYAGISLTFHHWYQDDPRAERAFCRVGVCDSSDAFFAIQKEHGGDADAVPRADLLEFLRRDPANSSRWADLGESLQRGGHTTEAQYCFQRAVALGPRLPYTLIRTARFRFGLGENRAALALMSRALEGNPSFALAVFRDYERLSINASDVISHGLPDDAAVWRSYLRRHVEVEVEPASESNADTAAVWDAIVSRGYADDKLASEYIEFVLRARGPEEAALAWGRYVGPAVESNRVFNGDFEADPRGSLFDWRLAPAPGVAIDFDRVAPYSGGRSLRVRFDGTANVSGAVVQQQVYLKPGRYRVSARVRTKELSTDQGVFLRVALVHAAAKQLDVATDNVRGSREWTLLESAFEAPPEGGLVRVSLERKRSLKFDNLVRGTVWIDQVSISPEL